MEKIIKKLLAGIMTMLISITTTANVYAESDAKKTEFIHNHSEILQSLNDCSKCWKKNGDVRIDFLEQMIHHNEIEMCMCENIIQYTDKKDVLNTAKSIIKNSMECNSELNELLDEIRKNPDVDKNKEDEYGREYDEKYTTMLLELQLKRDDNNIDKIYLCSAKKHHASMENMCEIITRYSDDEKINKLAKDMNQRLEKEIKKLNRVYKHVK
ncbi:MAG: DUF305 domain-containing protein [Clostridium sp.]|nr:DUF305 domain-containing protein [Clostridium sp.]